MSRTGGRVVGATGAPDRDAPGDEQPAELGGRVRSRVGDRGPGAGGPGASVVHGQRPDRADVGVRTDRRPRVDGTGRGRTRVVDAEHAAGDSAHAGRDDPVGERRQRTARQSGALGIARVERDALGGREQRIAAARRGTDGRRVPSAGASGATASVVKWKSGPSASTAAVAVSSFMVLPGASGSVPAAVTDTPSVSSCTTVHDCSPAARVASAAWRCCAPTASIDRLRQPPHRPQRRGEVWPRLGGGRGVGCSEPEDHEDGGEREHAHAEHTPDDGAAARHRRARASREAAPAPEARVAVQVAERGDGAVGSRRSRAVRSRGPRPGPALSGIGDGQLGGGEDRLAGARR